MKLNVKEYLYYNIHFAYNRLNKSNSKEYKCLEKLIDYINKELNQDDRIDNSKCKDIIIKYINMINEIKDIYYSIDRKDMIDIYDNDISIIMSIVNNF